MKENTPAPLVLPGTSTSTVRADAGPKRWTRTRSYRAGPAPVAPGTENTAAARALVGDQPAIAATVTAKTRPTSTAWGPTGATAKIDRFMFGSLMLELPAGNPAVSCSIPRVIGLRGASIIAPAG